MPFFFIYGKPAVDSLLSSKKGVFSFFKSQWHSEVSVVSSSNGRDVVIRLYDDCDVSLHLLRLLPPPAVELLFVGGGLATRGRHQQSLAHEAVDHQVVVPDLGEKSVSNKFAWENQAF